MAVSKHQNERPAIDALIDLANQLEGEIGDGFTETSVTTTVNLLGEGQSMLAEDVWGILATLENIKFGVVPLELTVPANDTYESAYVYPEPFDSSAMTLVMLGFADGPMPATLSLTLVDSSYSGFSYSITNTDTDPATVTLAYLAIAAIPLS